MQYNPMLDGRSANPINNMAHTMSTKLNISGINPVSLKPIIWFINPKPNSIIPAINIPVAVIPLPSKKTDAVGAQTCRHQYASGGGQIQADSSDTVLFFII